MPDASQHKNPDSDLVQATTDLIRWLVQFEFQQRFDDWAERRVLTLSSPGARDDCYELCQRGCRPNGLAILIGLLRAVRVIESLWTDPSEIRMTQSQTLEEAASIVKNSFPLLNDIERTESGSGPGNRAIEPRLTTELRFRSRLLVLPETLAEETGAGSLEETMKYLMIGYVKNATARWRDRNVSGILAELIGPAGYSADVHRVWRNRNFLRLDSNFSDLLELLCAIDGIPAHRIVTDTR